MNLEAVTEESPRDPAHPHRLSFFLGAQGGRDDPGRRPFAYRVVMTPLTVASPTGGRWPTLEERDGKVGLAFPWAQVWLREDTGELLEAVVDVAEEGDASSPRARLPTLPIRVCEGEFARLQGLLEGDLARLPEGRRDMPWADVLANRPFLRDVSLMMGPPEGTGQVLAAPDRMLMSGVRLTALLARTPEVAALFARRDDTRPETGFRIPPVPADRTFSNPLVVQIGALVYWAVIKALPADSWPARLTREAFYVAAGNSRNTAAVVEELYRDPEMGPLGSLVTARLLMLVKPPVAWRFARRAQDHATAEEFRKDWMLLCRRQTALGEAAQGVLLTLARLDAEEQDDLLAGLPPAAVAPARRVLEGLRATPNPTVAELLRPHLDLLWEDTLRKALADNVESCLVRGWKAPDAAIVAALVNGQPVSRKLVGLLATRGTQALPVPAFTEVPGQGTIPTEAQALEALIAEALVLQDLQAKGIAPDSSITAARQIKAIADASFGGDGGALRMALRQQQLTVADLGDAMVAAVAYREGVKALAAYLPKPTSAEVEAEALDMLQKLGPARLTSRSEAERTAVMRDLQRRALAELVKRRRDAAVASYLARLRAQAVVRILPDPAPNTAHAPRAAGALRTEMETAPVTTAPGLTLSALTMERWGAERWSAGTTAIVRGSGDAGWAEWRITVPTEGDYRLELLALRGASCPQIRVAVDGQDVGETVELFAPAVQPSGPLPLGTVHLGPGEHCLRCRVSGRHPSALGQEFGIDALDLIPVAPTPAGTTP